MKGKVYFSLYVLAAVALPSATAAQISQKADYILLSHKYGDAGYVGLMPEYGTRSINDPLDTFSARSMSGSEVASLFQKLCLSEPFNAAAYSEAMKVTAPEFRPTARNLPAFSAPKPLVGSFNVAETSLSQNFSEYGISSIWLGEDAEKLNNRPFTRFSGSLIITGPFESKNSYAPQCNVTVKVSTISDGKELIEAIQAALPTYSTAKRVEKPKYAYGIWLGSPIDGRIPRVTVTASKLNRSEQIVHLTIQLLPTGIIK
jgi:hypothetical protein